MEGKIDWIADVRKRVIARDGKCKSCKTTEDLGIACVRKYDRNSVDAWICLCGKCRKERNEKNRKTVVKGGDSCKRIMLRKIEEQQEEIIELRNTILRMKS
jgi:hypothetical protein